MNKSLVSALDDEAEALLENYLYQLIRGSHLGDWSMFNQAVFDIGLWTVKSLGYPSSDIAGRVLDEIREERRGQPKKDSGIKRDYRKAIFHRDNNQCVRCGSNESLTVDHIIPISKGGTDTLDNLRTLCRKCNCSKGNRKELDHAI